MSSSESSESNIKSEPDKKNDFGSDLAAARIAQNHTVEDVSEHIKIPASIITALEENDLSVLPSPTFALGYLRAYAKFLSLDSDSFVSAYNRAVPHDQTSELKPRSKLPNETNSQSPLVKIITLVLFIAGIAAAAYGGYQYYYEKADIMESELEARARIFNGGSLDSPTRHLKIKQNARLSDAGELLLNKPKVENVSNLNPAAAALADLDKQEGDQLADSITESDKKTRLALAKEKKKIIMAKDDMLEIFAEEDAWLDVRDASSARLFYNILKQGETASLKGRAPFNVSLGNARTTNVLINNLEIDMTRYIRRSNTAKFSVSSNQDHVIFH